MCLNLNRKETMNKLITPLILLIAPFALLAGCYGGGGSDQTPQQQLQQAQAQLTQQQASTGNWQIIAGIFAIGCILLFFIGAMLGSRTRRNAKQPDSSEEQ